LSTYIVVVDDEPDVESMFRQHFRRDLRSGRFVMEFALSALAALEQVKVIPDPSLILILSDINMPGMSGLEMLPEVKAERPNVPVIMITAYGELRRGGGRQNLERLGYLRLNTISPS
jgi:CheY-like chemotaxis protein